MTANVTLISDIYDRGLTTTMVVIIILVAAVTAAGNVFVIIAIIKSKKMRRPLYILFINFNIADFLLSTTIVPGNIIAIVSDGQLATHRLCFYLLYGNTTTISSSATTLSFIAWYRLAQICYHKVYCQIRKPVYIATVIFLTWSPSLILCWIFGRHVHFSPYYLTCEFTGRYIYPISICLIFAPACLSIFLSYVKICIYTRNSRRKIHDRHILDQLKEGVTSNRASSTATVGSSTKEKPQKYAKVFQTISFIFLDVALFYFLPALIISLRDILESNSAYGYLMVFTFILKRIRPLASLVLYFLTNSELRENVLIKLCRCKPDHSKLRTLQRNIRIGVTASRPDGPEQQRSTSKASSNLVLTPRPHDITSEAGSTFHSPSISNISHM